MKHLDLLSALPVLRVFSRVDLQITNSITQFLAALAYLGPSYGAVYWLISEIALTLDNLPSPRVVSKKLFAKSLVRLRSQNDRFSKKIVFV